MIMRFKEFACWRRLNLDSGDHRTAFNPSITLMTTRQWRGTAPSLLDESPVHLALDFPVLALRQ